MVQPFRDLEQHLQCFLQVEAPLIRKRESPHPDQMLNGRSLMYFENKVQAVDN